MGKLIAAALAGLGVAVMLSAPASAYGQYCSVQCSGRQSISYQDWLNCMNQCYQDGGQ